MFLPLITTSWCPRTDDLMGLYGRVGDCLETRENVQNCSVVCDRAKRRDFHADAEGSSGEVDIDIKRDDRFLGGCT